MGGLITVDPALLELAERGPSYRIAAHSLAVMQHHIARDHQHIVALNDEFVRKAIIRAAKLGKIPQVNVRCLRCAAAASLTDWITLSLTPKIEKGALWEAVRNTRGSAAARFTQICPGAGKADMLLEVLESYARETL